MRPEPAAARTTHRRAVVALAAGLTVAAAVQLAMGWAIQTDRVPLRDPLYLDKLAMLRVHPGFTPSTSPEELRTIIFVGSSRTLDGIDAGAVGAKLTRHLGAPVEAFNFAVHGAGPVTNTLYLRRLLAAGMKPNVVVIEVHPVFLAAQLPVPLEARWLFATRLWPEEPPLLRRLGYPIATPDTHGCRAWLLPWFVYRTPITERYAPRFSVHRFPLGDLPLGDEHGFLRCPGVPRSERLRLLALTHKQYAEFLPGYQPGGCGLAAVRDSLAACNAAGIRAALILSPESTEFRNWYPEPGRSQIVPLLAEMAREYHYPLIDARAWLADDLIRDGHHLSGRGADAFTERLTRDALAPMLRTPEPGGTP